MDVRQVTSRRGASRTRSARSATTSAAGRPSSRPSASARNLPLERMHAAFDGEKIVGGAGAFPFELTIPGGQLGCGGVTVVGVLPTHRRRGVLTSMMRAQLEDIRDRGEPLAALWASEEAIYRRYGYGMAALGTELTLARGYQTLRPAANTDVTVRLVSLEEAKELVPPIYERTRLRTPGMYARSLRLVGDADPRRPARPARGRRRQERRDRRARRRSRRLRALPRRLEVGGGGERRPRADPRGDGRRRGRARALALPARARLGRQLPRDASPDRPSAPARARLPAPGAAAGLRHALRPARRRRHGARRALLRETRSRSCSSWRTRSCRRTAGAGGSRTAAPSGRTTRPIWRSTSPRPPRSTSAASAPPSSCAPGSSASCARARRQRADRLFATARKPWCPEIF